MPFSPKVIAAVLLALGLLVLVLGYRQVAEVIAPPPTVREQVDAADAALRQGETEQARKGYLKALEHARAEARQLEAIQALTGLSRASSSAGNSAEAEEYLRQAISSPLTKVNPILEAEAWAALAEFYVTTDKPQKASVAILKSLKISEGNVSRETSLRHLSAVALGLADHKACVQAEPLLQEAARQRRNAQEFAQAARLLERLGECQTTRQQPTAYFTLDAARALYESLNMGKDAERVTSAMRPLTGNAMTE
jgi:tetratricopeptide (TPR) repeat protein